ncbi:hypothetical protein [Kitasatospora viridis]|uniref:Uncharacterized protein n=1 Tax=Kitasatospora viridis TaxID=281105 RepID=A0A561S9Y7_9ACTN|nr:hypothetical protein [Kitasatospora viridis]TWF71693.1 hypothetical protein FHX73_1864 [Kitasatospora viridis]
MTIATISTNSTGPTPPAVLYGLTLQQRNRTVLVAAISDLRNNRHAHEQIHPLLADILGVNTWLTELWESYSNYQHTGVAAIYQKVRLTGRVLEVLDLDNRVVQRRTPLTAALTLEPQLLSWALDWAATERAVIDPDVTSRAERVLCTAAGIGELTELMDEVLTERRRHEGLPRHITDLHQWKVSQGR